MYDFSVPMALIDYIPVLFFGIAAVLLQLDLYGKMRKDAFALFAAGTINIFAAGFLKASWKLLYAAGICDFQALNTLFLPLQSIGFLLAGLGIVLMLCTQKHKAMLAAAPPVFSGKAVFISMMVLGLAAICAGLGRVAVKMKKKSAALFFLLSFLCSMCMGYLSSKDSTSALVNWIEQSVNCLGQGMLLWGVVILHRAGLKQFDL